MRATFWVDYPQWVVVEVQEKPNSEMDVAIGLSRMSNTAGEPPCDVDQYVLTVTKDGLIIVAGCQDQDVIVYD